MAKLILLKGAKSHSKTEEFNKILSRGEGCWIGSDRNLLRNAFDCSHMDTFDIVKMQRDIITNCLEQNINVVVNVYGGYSQKWQELARQHGAVYEEIDFNWLTGSKQQLLLT